MNTKIFIYIHKLLEEDKLDICPEIMSTTTKSKEDILTCLNIKEDLYEFFTKDLHLVLPDFFRCPHIFMIDIAFGKKKFLKEQNVIEYKEREYSHLKLDAAFGLWIADLKDYLPDIEVTKSSKNLYCRDFFFTLVNSILKEKADEHKRKESVRGKKKAEANNKAEGKVESKDPNDKEAKNGKSEQAEGEEKANVNGVKVITKRKKAEKDSTKKSASNKKQKRIVFSDDIQERILAKYKDVQGEEIELNINDLKEIISSVNNEASKPVKAQHDPMVLPPISSIFFPQGDLVQRKRSDEDPMHVKSNDEYGIQGRPT